MVAKKFTIVILILLLNLGFVQLNSDLSNSTTVALKNEKNLYQIINKEERVLIITPASEVFGGVNDPPVNNLLNSLMNYTHLEVHEVTESHLDSFDVIVLIFIDGKATNEDQLRMFFDLLLDAYKQNKITIIITSHFQAHLRDIRNIHNINAFDHEFMKLTPYIYAQPNESPQLVNNLTGIQKINLNISQSFVNGIESFWPEDGLIVRYHSTSLITNELQYLESVKYGDDVLLATFDNILLFNLHGVPLSLEGSSEEPVEKFGQFRRDVITWWQNKFDNQAVTTTETQNITTTETQNITTTETQNETVVVTTTDLRVEFAFGFFILPLLPIAILYYYKRKQ